MLVTFVGYHTALLWLSGTTTGKTMFRLRLHRLGDRAYRRTAAGLAWAFLRTTVGYLLVDLVIVGWLVAVFRAERRPLHDIVFRSQVVQEPASVDVSVAGRLRGVADRVEEYGGEVESQLQLATT